MVRHRRLDLGRDPVGVRPARAGQAADQPLGAVGLEVAADLVELLARVTHDHAGLGDVVQLLGQLQHRQLAAATLSFVVMSFSGLRDGCLDNTILPRSGAAWPHPPSAGMANCQAIALSLHDRIQGTAPGKPRQPPGNRRHAQKRLDHCGDVGAMRYQVEASCLSPGILVSLKLGPGTWHGPSPLATEQPSWD